MHWMFRLFRTFVLVACKKLKHKKKKTRDRHWFARLVLSMSNGRP